MDRTRLPKNQPIQVHQHSIHLEQSWHRLHEQLRRYSFLISTARGLLTCLHHKDWNRVSQGEKIYSCYSAQQYRYISSNYKLTFVQNAFKYANKIIKRDGF